MVISDFAIKRPMITVVVMVALVIFGLFALALLQTDEFPDIQAPVVLVGIPYPGGSPEGVEREVLKPVEDAIKGISGVDKMYGTATDGYAQIIVIFVFEKEDFLGSCRSPRGNEGADTTEIRSNRSSDSVADSCVRRIHTGAAYANG